MRERISVNMMLMRISTEKMTAHWTSACTSLLGTASSSTRSMMRGVYRLAMEARMLRPSASSICTRWRRMY